MKKDYKEIGFKAGLEIHQQLDTRKLFCNCPSLVNDPNEPTVKISRKLLVTESELGKKDIAAEFEAKKQKTYIYEACPTSSCLVELDDEPPHPINQHALEIAIQVSALINAEIVPEVHVMRKIILDGSNVSGFQRTALIARNGHINTSKGKVNIPTVYLEEEAAKKIKETDKIVIYRLDRLGVPLLEISTSPGLQDPEHVQEAASIIGMILRSTESVKRGIGSIRQDVNLSIKGNPRVELKGFQDLRSIPTVIENEIGRMLNQKDKDPHVRKVEPDLSSTYLRPMPTSARMYPETDIPTFEITNNLISSIKIPELISDRSINFEKKYNIPAQYALELVKQNLPFDYYAEKYCLEPKFIAHLLIEIPKELKSRFNIKEEPKKEHFDFILQNIENKSISKEAAIEVLKDLVQGYKLDLSKYSTASLGEVESFIKDLVEKNKGISISGLMGDAMKKYRGKVDGKLVMELINRYRK